MLYTNLFKSEVLFVNEHYIAACAAGMLLCEKRTQNIYFDKRSYLIKTLLYDIEVNILLLLFNSSVSSC